MPWDYATKMPRVDSGAAEHCVNVLESVDVWQPMGPSLRGISRRGLYHCR